MKIFILNNPANNGALKTSDEVLNSDVYGVSLNMKLGQFMVGGTDFGGAIPELKNEVKRIANWTKDGKPMNKKVKLSIMCGDYARNITGVRYVTLIESNHEGSGTPHGISVPVPYDENYLNYLESFLTWFAGQLKSDSDVLDGIEAIVLTWNNQSTAENRTPNQDFTVGDAYYNAAVKWQSEGYTTEKIKDSFSRIALKYVELFDGKTIVLQIIKGVNGAPCINDAGEICEPNKRPKLAEQLCTEIAQPLGITCGFCYMNATVVAPTYISSKPAFYQTQNKTVATKADFDLILANAEKQNCEILEIQYKVAQGYLF